MKKLFGKYKTTKTGKSKGRPVEIKICTVKPKNTKEFMWKSCNNSFIPKNQRTAKWGINFLKLKNSFEYCIGIDYDTYRTTNNCDRNGCRDICRCLVIDKVQVLEDGLLRSFISTILKQIYPINLSYCKELDEFIHRVDFIKPTGLLAYAVDRLARQHKAYDRDNYTVHVKGGYYGDEIADITFNNFDAFKDDLKRVLQKSFHEGILELLSVEYDSVNNSFIKKLIEEGRRFKEIIVPLVSLKAGALAYGDCLRKKNERYPDLDIDLPVGVYRECNNKFVVIDGYHRLFGLNHAENVKIISI